MTASAHKSLAEALAAFQGEAPTLTKGNTAEVVSKRTGGKYTYKYVDLSDVVEAIKPLMVKHGLSFSAFPCFDEKGEPALRYALRHVGGDCESAVMPLMLAAADAQAMGSAITYARRYALTAVLNIVADVDDDGKAATEHKRTASRQPTAQPSNGTERPASAAQRGMLNGKASDAGLPPSDFANAILKATGQEARDFDSQEQAAQWVKRALDRLPAKHVNNVLDEIAKLAEVRP